MERDKIFKLKSFDVLADFNSLHGTNFTTVDKFNSSYDVDYVRYTYTFGMIEDCQDGTAFFIPAASRCIIESGVDAYLPGDQPGVHDNLSIKKLPSCYRIGDLVDGIRTLRGNMPRMGAPSTTVLTDPTIARFLDWMGIPEFAALLSEAVEKSQGRISGIYNTCQSRRFKSGWAYHKLKDLCQDRSFQAPFLDKYYFADPKPICIELWHKFLAEHRPDEMKLIELENSVRSANFLNDSGF